jgi:low temperature requirement protein LtrA
VQCGCQKGLAHSRSVRTSILSLAFYDELHTAINIEHHVERLGAFVTIVLGEMVVNVLFKSTNASGLDACVV